MRHGKKFNHLSRTASHRNAMLSNMASSLIEHKRITTTVAKAKALRKYVEPILTKAKDNTTHSRRVVFGYLQNKYAVQTLFDEVASKIADRPGGYTRIIKMGTRLGDNAEMAMIELVDYNELLLQEDKPAKAKTRRSRRGGGAKKTETTPKAEVESAEVTEQVAESDESVEVQEPAAEIEESVEVESVEEATQEVAEPEADVTEEEATAETAEDVVEEPKEEVAAEVETETSEEVAEEPKAEASEEPKAEEEKPEEKSDNEDEEKKD